MYTVPISLTHLASLIFSAVVLIVQPEFAGIVLFLAGFNFSFTLISVIALGHCFLTKKFSGPAGPLTTLMAAHCGSMLCYIITMNYAIAYSS